MIKLCLYLFIGVVGVALLATSFVFFALIDGIIDKQVQKELPIKNGSDSYKTWQKPNVPIYFKVWVFNVKNADEVMRKNFSTKPELEEVGPYVFEERREKLDINFVDNGTTVDYREKQTFFFSPEKTDKKWTLKDRVTVINFPILITFNVIKENPFIGGLKKQLIEELKKDVHKSERRLFLNLTVGQLLFQGIKLSSLNILNDIKKGLNKEIGIFTSKNTTDLSKADKWTVYTGVKDMRGYLTIAKLNDKEKMNWWVKDSHCNNLTGTDGTQFAPPVKKYDRLYIFSPELCRSAFFEFFRHEEVDGINLLRFKIPLSFYENPMKNKENDCYCTKKENERKKKCNVAGVLDISSYLKKKNSYEAAPIIMSAHNFMHASPEIRNQFTGIPDPKSDEDKFGTIIDVEPYTGFMLRAYKRLQVNFELINYNWSEVMEVLGEYREGIFPLVKVEETVDISESPDKIKELKEKVINKVKLAYGLIIAGIVVGGLLSLLSAALLIWARPSPKKKKFKR